MPSAKQKGKGQDSKEETQRYAVRKPYKALTYQPNDEYSKKIKDAYNNLTLKLGRYYMDTVKVKDYVEKMIRHKRFVRKEKYDYAWDNEIYAMIFAQIFSIGNMSTM